MKRVIPAAGTVGFAVGVLAVGTTGVHARQWADEATSAVLLIGLCAITLAGVRRMLNQQAEQPSVSAPRACCRAAEQLEATAAALAEEQERHAQTRADYSELNGEHNVLIQQTLQGGYETFLPRDHPRAATRRRPPDPVAAQPPTAR